MKSTEKQELKTKIKRLGLFFVIVFLPAMIISVLMWWAGVDMWLNVLVLVVVLAILYFLYAFLWDKIDKKKNKRLQNKKDPFSD